jgi:hypothetical protein
MSLRAMPIRSALSVSAGFIKYPLKSSAVEGVLEAEFALCLPVCQTFANFGGLSAPKTEVVMPDECQSIPITEPSA